ncbi:MAG TPA: Rne/Rng family ribonuclease [Bryobacteraceae bacterium]|jgi:ribonuclease G|nr:Rne/Rng family ribonuclease [Bryobacteraceae bacterium]
MSKELVISSNRHETRVALIEDDQLVEVYFQRANEYSLAGSIHKGRVTRVLPGMQSAFVDLGLERDTFLYVSDFLEEHEDIDRVTGEERPPRERERRPPPPAQGAEPVQAPPGEAPPQASERPEQGRDDRGDRRGRRSRRRRNRGRGFPESKYAPEGAPSDVQTPAADVETEPQAEPAGEESVPLILPGESLAKYQGAARPQPETAPQSLAVNGTAEQAEIAAEDAEETVETEFDEPLHYPPENALPDAPAHEAREVVLGEGPAPAAEEAEHIEEAEMEIAPAVAPLLDEEEDRDIQEMILSHTEGAEELVEETEESGADRPAEAEPESGAAEVRERGGRYPHRVSRRMRRRMRGGEGGREHTREPRPATERTVTRPQGQQISISDMLKEGQEIIVQVAKEPLGQKGARITSHIALPGRYVVYMPTLEHMGVSRKISSDEERLRLKRILQARRPGPAGGFITRTAAEGRSEEEIAADMAFLYNLWQDIKAKAERKPAPVLLHHDLDIVQRILRDQLADSFKAIWIDNEDTYESVLRFVERFQPALVGKVKLYTRDAPIFDAFNVTAELEKALRPKVWLKSGGFIVINQTEALVAIDVNTGKYVGKTNRLEDTIVKTNMEAIKEIVRQMRLRDLGGIIVIDFIDMDERKNRQKVMQALEEAMRADRAPYKILQFNDFGLVAITRKRVKQSLERTLCSPCPYCDGAGYIKSVQTVVSEILTEARKVAGSIEGKDVMLRVHPDVAKVLKSHQNKYLEELEEVLRRPVLVKSDPLLHHEKFDLA